MIDNLKSKVVKGIIWQGIERFSTQGIQFCVSVILARLLEPEAFGLIALVLVFLVISDIFVDGGFRNTIIQSKSMTRLGMNSIFWCNLGIACCMYIILWCIAPYVARYYEHPELMKILRVLGVIPVIHSLAIVNNAVLIKEMMFKKKTIIAMGAICFSAPCGIIMAYCGMGVWSLIAMRLVEALALAILTICFVRWFPSFNFSWKKLCEHFKFGGNLLCTSLLDQLFLNGFQLFTGKYFNLSLLAFYNRGNSYAKLAMNAINNTISVVMFPAFSKLQNDPNALREALRKAIKVLLFIEIPLLCGLAVCAKPLVIILLTEKWSEATFFLVMACIEYLFWPLQVLNIWCVLARGESSTVLKIEIAKKLVLITAIVLTFHFGFKVMIAAWTAGSILNFGFNSYPNGKALNYGPYHQIKDLLPTFLITGVAAGLALLFIYVPCGSWGQLFGRGGIFVVVYLVLSLICQRQLFEQCLKLVKKNNN